MRRVRVTDVGACCRRVQYGLVGDVANRTSLCAGAEQGALRPLQHLDALEIYRVQVKIAPRQLGWLIVEVHRHVREAADGSGSAQGCRCRGQPAQEDRALARSGIGGCQARHILGEVVKRHRMQLLQ